MDVFTNIDTTHDTWQTGTTPTGNYSCRYNYDENGNIMGLLRKATTTGGTPLNMDSLVYHYTAGTNKLLYVHDTVGASRYPNDIDNEPINNYSYDQIGNMIKDSLQQIASVTWNSYGKIKSITRTTGSTKPNMLFYYGPDGNRIAKISGTGTDPAKWLYTYYVRDATGNIMAVYSRHIHEKANTVVGDIQN